MLSSITPLGERGRSNSYAATATAHVVGSTLGGVVIGAIAGLVGLAIGVSLDVAAAVLVLALVASVAVDLFYAPSHHLPGVHRQVDEKWIDEYRGWVYGGGFGFQLGTGVMTFITTASVYVMLIAAVVQQHWWAAVAVGATFGLTRGLMVLSAARVRRPRELSRFHQQRASLERPFNFGAAASLLVLAMCVAALAIDGGVT